MPAAEAVEAVLLSLSGPSDVDQVVTGPDGVLAGLRAGDAIIDLSTNAPSMVRSLAELSAAKGIGFLDAPVSGGTRGARKATLDRTAEAAGEHLGRLGRTGPNTRIATRAVVGMIMVMALFHDFGNPTAGRRPTRDEVIDEMTQIVLHGGLNRPQPRAPKAVRNGEKGQSCRRCDGARAPETGAPFPAPANRRRGRS